MDAAIRNPPNARIAVVTGGNKGIGIEVCRQLAGAGITVVLTARDEKRGTSAAEKLREAGLSGVIFHQLEITDAPSIARLADFLKTRFGKLDILVNNAAIGAVEYVHDPADGSLSSEEKFSGMDRQQRLEWMFNAVRETYDSAREGVQINYYGTKHVIEALLPLLQASSDGRIVNVSSDAGLLRVTYFDHALIPTRRLLLQFPIGPDQFSLAKISFPTQHIRNEELKRELSDIDSLTEERLDEVLDTFLKDFKAGDLEERRWPIVISAYKMAKVALNAYSRMLARTHPELRVNCVHPGYVDTDMTMHSGPLTPEEGAANVVKVALLPEGGPTGAYFALGQEAQFV
ncbi:unnamed protein product [Urochloa decumbens]|uniref:(+)-neomenthol dehydrogenase n=1 Tax=Urochloa decumbens TaxID=240449 RepID=A0ABC9F3L0_9POAL